MLCGSANIRILSRLLNGGTSAVIRFQSLATSQLFRGFLESRIDRTGCGSYLMSPPLDALDAKLATKALKSRVLSI